MVALLDCRAPRAIVEHLEQMGYQVCPMPVHPALPSPVSAHPDLLIFFGEDAILSTKDYYSIAKKELDAIGKACGKELVLVEQTPSNVYPGDVLLNAAQMGEHLLCLPGATAREILSRYSKEKLLPVRQGYAKCSVLPVTSSALITSDPSIARVAAQKGLEVLQIEAGQINLVGYDTGFIGGASSVSPYRNRDEILFCGDLDGHTDGPRIREFCLSHQKKPIEIKGLPLTDVGTVFLI